MNVLKIRQPAGAEPGHDVYEKGMNLMYANAPLTCIRAYLTVGYKIRYDHGALGGTVILPRCTVEFAPKFVLRDWK
jgi:hypothetical protein